MSDPRDQPITRTLGELAGQYNDEAPYELLTPLDRWGWPEGATGIRWTDTDWTECRETVDTYVLGMGDSGVVGTVIFGRPGRCNACREGGGVCTMDPDR